MRHDTNPFLIVPWDTDILATLERKVLELTDNQPGNAVIVFPHGRPARHLIDRLLHSKAVPKPCLLPRMHTVQELFTLIRAEVEQRPPHPVELLDRVGLLLQCVRDLAAPGTELCSRLARGGERHFFPWGVRLASLMEEFFTQGLEPEDLVYMEGQVAPFAVALLESLGRIHESYIAALDEKGWTTPGLDAFRAAQHPDALPQTLAGREIIIAGFATLNGTEEKLFRHLWEHAGAHIMLHTDPAVAAMGAKRVHWTCEEHVRWLTSWHAQAELGCSPSGIRPRMDFCEGYDLHSQLHALGTLLNDTEDLASSAVVLPDTGLLMPVLHHLPAKDVNISMGYPLARSTLFRLLETVMRLQETRSENGLYHWRECIDLIRHPYLKMLEVDGVRPLPDIFHGVENRLRKGNRFLDLRLMMEEVLASSDASAAATELGREVLSICLTRWELATTPASIADALFTLCNTLLEHGGDLWQRFPIDAECLYRLMQRVIPALGDSALAATPFPRDVLFTILRETIRGERVPFEADPLGGLQVLGLLESRLLHFKRIIVLDATDDRLPGAPANDPLLPDSLRTQVGLPDARRRERVAAHNFHRLLAGAEEVTLLWQNGVERSGLLDEKKIRSRFVEELLWNEERTAQKLLAPGEGPLRAVTCTVRPFTPRMRAVEKTDAVRESLHRYLERPLSPSRLDAYLSCPFRFFHEHICKLAPPVEVLEGDDPASVGNLLHDTLQRFYEPWKGRTVSRGDLSPDVLERMFREQLAQMELAEQLPADSLVMLETAGPIRLRRFLEAQPESTTILGLEDTYTSAFTISGRRRLITGRLDRVDRRGKQGAIILDYKTGGVRIPPVSIWQDDDLWSRLSNWMPAMPAENDPLSELADRLRSIQLPSYIHMYGHTTGNEVHDAALVELRNHGEEKYLMGPKMDDETREDVIANLIPAALTFILRHMEEAPAFMPREGTHCDWCSFAKLCKV